VRIATQYKKDNGWESHLQFTHSCRLQLAETVLEYRDMFLQFTHSCGLQPLLLCHLIYLQQSCNSHIRADCNAIIQIALVYTVRLQFTHSCGLQR